MDKKTNNKPNIKFDKKKKKKIVITGAVVFLIIMLVLGFTLGGKIVSMVRDPKVFRNWVQGTGIWGKFLMIGISAFQIIVAVIPGEPIEIASGYAFGWIEGAILCLIGTLIGQTIVFLFAKKYGMDFVEVFVKKEKIEKVSFLNDSEKIYISIFLIFLIPGTPKDVLSYVAGITPVKLLPFLLVSCLARIPSVVSSTIGGSFLGTKNYKMAFIVFGVTIVISGIVFFIYKQYQNKKEIKN
ncbi:TVP38/TMEM64 family protein [Terrisporobacter sp.]|uniref:TVP38/TMEM64 family protein n=1 Tax=Terrisporobacter sp. TaxID=1965305 RepID=UPI0026156987|nr:TVP38/TMEM64 family protein [Terrisporobacter sp.]